MGVINIRNSREKIHLSIDTYLVVPMEVSIFWMEKYIDNILVLPTPIFYNIVTSGTLRVEERLGRFVFTPRHTKVFYLIFYNGLGQPKSGRLTWSFCLYSGPY